MRFSKNIRSSLKILAVSAAVLLSSGISNAQSQEIDSPLLIFNRGKLWQSIFLGKIGPSAFNNWRRLGIGLDWPGFDPSLINEDIGGAASHLLAGGFWVGCKKSQDSVLAVEDWSIYASSVGVEPTAKYLVKRHKKNENHWLQNDPLKGEEYIETVWEYNPGYLNEFDLERQLPLRVTRTSHQWSGSKSAENFIIHEYTIENIADEIRLNFPDREISDSLYDFYALLNYGLHANSRSWRVLFPNLSEGARNTWLFYDPGRKMIWGRAGDFKDTSPETEDFGYSPILGPIIDGKPTGEWLAPGFIGVRLLYASPNNNGSETFVNATGWSAADNSQDLIGPMSGIGTRENRYEVLKDPSLAYNPVASPADDLMRRSRMWSMISLGPWDLFPGDSIKIVIAEMVDGVDYKYALDKNAQSIISNAGLNIFNQTADKAKFAFDNDLNHPDPPAAPDFEVSLFSERENIVANVITWKDDSEFIPDPDDGIYDLHGYRVYRSGYLNIGPWDSVATIIKGDPDYYDPASREYRFIDSTVTVGASYFYSVTAYDTGRTVWNINPSAIHPQTRSTRVPSLESSIYANKLNSPFVATLAPVSDLDKILVVPNPFVIGEGFSLPGEEDKIQFVNLPNPCTVRIYTVRGDLVKTIEVREGAGAIAQWDQVTDFGQFVESGIYIFHVDSPIGTKIGKFAIIR